MTDKPRSASAQEGSPRVTRHHLIDRLYHWLMAICVFILLGTAFLPIIGIKFEWVDIHWMTGVVLAFIVLVHIVRALFWQDWRAMVIDGADIRSMASGMKDKPGKYNPLQKLYHLGVAVFILAIIGSGLLMLLKIDTPFWRRNPYWFSNETWGYIYALHGLAAMAMVTMIIIHVYFAIRPEEWYLTRSMFRGWITRKEYGDHHDKNRWQA